MGELGTYTTITLGEAESAASSTSPSGVPAEVPAHWQVYFAVEDADATVAKAEGAAAGLGRPDSTSPQVASRSSLTPAGRSSR